MLSAPPIDTTIECASAPQHTLELGMHMLGINGLLESSLFAEAIDFRLRALAGRTGVVSRDVRGSGGQRLYATVFYLELRTPAAMPVACWGENDTLRFVEQSRLAGRGLLDGYVLFDRPGHPEGAVPDRLATPDLQAGTFAWLRAAHKFAHDQRGPTELELAEPVNLPAEQVGRWATPCSAVPVHRRAQAYALDAPPAPYHALRATPYLSSIPVAVERDLNGVGLMYFARYPQILDVAERHALRDGVWPPCEDFVIEGRSPIARTMCFFGNAVWSDTLLVETRLWVADLRAEGLRTVTGAYAPLRLRSQAALFRESDRRLIAVSEAEKVVMVPRVSPGVSGAIERLLRALPR